MTIMAKVILWIVYLIFLLLWHSNIRLVLFGEEIAYALRWWTLPISVGVGILTSLPTKKKR